MFAVIFEVNPRPDLWDAYLGYARSLRPELEQIDGFIDNERFSSLRREGWLLSLSIWRDEKAVIRWRTAARHHEIQQKGRSEVFRDYRLRVGEITDNQVLGFARPGTKQRFHRGLVHILCWFSRGRPIGSLTTGATPWPFHSRFCPLFGYSYTDPPYSNSRSCERPNESE